jgi:Fe-S cluster biogenesis protein NfuA
MQSDIAIINRIQHIFDQIRLNVQMDGGDVDFVKFENGIVYIRLSGACVGCPSAFYTLKFGIEQTLKDAIPEVVEVVPISE